MSYSPHHNHDITGGYRHDHYPESLFIGSTRRLSCSPTNKGDNPFSRNGFGSIKSSPPTRRATAIAATSEVTATGTIPNLPLRGHAANSSISSTHSSLRRSQTTNGKEFKIRRKAPPVLTEVELRAEEEERELIAVASSIGDGLNDGKSEKAEGASLRYGKELTTGKKTPSVKRSSPNPSIEPLSNRSIAGPSSSLPRSTSIRNAISKPLSQTFVHNSTGAGGLRHSRSDSNSQDQRTSRPSINIPVNLVPSSSVSPESTRSSPSDMSASLYGHHPDATSWVFIGKGAPSESSVYSSSLGSTTTRTSTPLPDLNQSRPFSPTQKDEEDVSLLASSQRSNASLSRPNTPQCPPSRSRLRLGKQERPKTRSSELSNTGNRKSEPQNGSLTPFPVAAAISSQPTPTSPEPRKSPKTPRKLRINLPLRKKSITGNQPESSNKSPRSVRSPPRTPRTPRSSSSSSSSSSHPTSNFSGLLSAPPSIPPLPSPIFAFTACQFPAARPMTNLLGSPSTNRERELSPTRVVSPLSMTEPSPLSFPPPQRPPRSRPVDTTATNIPTRPSSQPETIDSRKNLAKQDLKAATENYHSQPLKRLVSVNPIAAPHQPTIPRPKTADTSGSRQNRQKSCLEDQPSLRDRNPNQLVNEKQPKKPQRISVPDPKSLSAILVNPSPKIFPEVQNEARRGSEGADRSPSNSARFAWPGTNKLGRARSARNLSFGNNAPKGTGSVSEKLGGKFKRKRSMKASNKGLDGTNLKEHGDSLNGEDGAGNFTIGGCKDNAGEAKVNGEMKSPKRTAFDRSITVGVAF